MDSPPEAASEDAEDVDSRTDPACVQHDKDMVTVDFYAVLRNSSNFQSEDTMCICGHEGKIMEMKHLSSESFGKLFHTSISMDSFELFPYKYCCFNKDGKEKFEQLTADGNNMNFRVLNVKELLLPDCKDAQQYDDICMKSSKPNFKKTVIGQLRPKFLQTVLHFVLRCNDSDLHCLEKKFQYILKSIKRRQLLESPTTLECKEITQHLEQALNDVIESFSTLHPLSYLLATAFFVKQTNTNLKQKSIEKLSEFAKQQALKDQKMPDLTKPMRREICFTVGQLLETACKRGSPDAVWLIGLFYKVLLPDMVSEEKFQKEISDSKILKWTATDKKCQTEISEMVKHHQEQLQEHRQFSEIVLEDMFSVNVGDPNVLRGLRLKPSDFLLQLKRWIASDPNLCSSEKLGVIIKTVAELTKTWFQSSPCRHCEEIALVTEDCIKQAVDFIIEIQKRKPDRQLPSNIVSTLILLNSVSEVLMLPGKKEIEKMFPEVEKCLTIWIKTAAETFSDLQSELQFFTRVFQIVLPPWQKRWKKTLKKLLTDFIQKMGPKQIMQHYFGYIENDSTIEECLLQCAINTVKHKVGHLSSNMKSKKYYKLISSIITDIWKDLKDGATDWEYLLTDPHCLELLDVLGKLQQENPNYNDELTEQAKNLLTHTKCLLSKLSTFYEVPSNLTTNLLKDQNLINTIQLHLVDKSVLGPAVEKIRDHIREFQEKQEQSKALLQLLQLIQDKAEVNTEQMRQNIKVDVCTEHRPLNQLLKLWEDVDILCFGNMKLASKSRVFQYHWESSSEIDRQVHDAATMSLSELHERIYKPALAGLETSYENIKDVSMQVDEFEARFKDCDEKQIEEELTLLQRYLSDCDNSTWIKDAYNCIKVYRELCYVVKQAQAICSLKEKLNLQGDFHFLPELCDNSLQTKHLGHFTKETALIGRKLSEVDDPALDLIKEFNECVQTDFITWIKSVIKDQKELNVFVELASAFAGEDPMDLDKVKNFRDAVFACSPLIFELDMNTGFDNLMNNIRKLKEAIKNDPDLHKKLRDSRTYQEWLKTAHTAHGSVTKSSLLQAKEINKYGVYYIRQPSSQSLITVDNCISLEIKGKKFELSQLQDLQNKFMLISAEDGLAPNKTASIFVEVLEQILHAGQLLIKLREAGHILFTDWSLTAFCDKSRKVSVHVDFGITGLKLTGNQSLQQELKGICKSMQDCLEKWINYTTQHRDEYYFLNYFTAKQLSRLCSSMACMQRSHQVPSSVLNMLSFIKENVTVDDLLEAYTAALKCPIQNASFVDLQSFQVQDFLIKYPELIEYAMDAGYSEASAKAAVIFCKQSGVGLDVDEDAVMDCVYENSNNEDWVKEWCVKYEEERENVFQSQMKFTGGHSPEQMKPAFTVSGEDMMKMMKNLTSCQEKITFLWETYCGKLSGLVSDKYVGLDLLGETLKQLTAKEKAVQRKMPRFLGRRQPNLISCNSTEMLPQCLTLYLDPNQPLPTYDEILICTSETTAEDVELIIRRAVQSGSRHEKIYSLLNAENLKPEVARVLESRFCHLSQSQKVSESKQFNFVIFCNTKAHHSYVLTAFDEYRKTLQAKECKDIQQLLKMKHKLSSASKFPADIIQEEFRQNIKMICSAKAGMGKTLFVNNLIRRSKEQLTSQGFTHKTISITNNEIQSGFIYEKLKEYEDNPNDSTPRIFHFDVPPVVSKGLYTFLVQLFVLRCFQSLDGFIWKCKDTHIYLIEYTERKHRQCDRENSEISTHLEDCLLAMFPTVRCLSPKTTLECLTNNTVESCECQSMDDTMLRSEEFQRTYQYLKHFKDKKFDEFKFDHKCLDSIKDWLNCILPNCKISDPSWAELCNFTRFLNMQLKRCETSVFCSDLLRHDLTGFRHFVVKSMITMSKDFSLPSLVTSDQSGCREKTRSEEHNEVLKEFQIRKHWEQEAHPYIMFNSDGVSMTFLGFHIQNRNAVDVRTGQIIERNCMTPLLFHQLKAQRVPMNVDFKSLHRSEQIRVLCRVLGVKEKDPDSTYQLTLDNALKILAIHLRFQCNIPVVIMGETGCGKTRLVKFMCDLLKKKDDETNLMVVRVHGGTTSDMIYKKVKHAVNVSKKNKCHGMYTVLFFDEANTTEALYAIKEVMCDRTVNGTQIDAPDLKFVAACNPYRTHTKSAIEQLEKAGLGYKVCAEDASEKLGNIPMRQLVYRVHPLPASFSPLVWDFGELNEHTQELYIAKMVETFFTTEHLDRRYKSLFTNVLNQSQTYMTNSNECRMVSLRDIERCMKSVLWFYQQRETLFPLIEKRRHKGTDQRNIDDIIRSLILAVGVCYSASLEERREYIKKIAGTLSLTAQIMQDEIDLCQEVFVENMDIPAATAKNDALKENVFMMIVCMNLRLPLFLVGKPGSSKSLSKTLAADALQGKSSRSELFKNYKQAQLLSFQCSAHSTSDGIISTFRQCAQLQKDKKLDEYVSVVVLDEIGLAEDSPKMPLKILHPLLECGCIDDEQLEDFKKVGFIGMSNWSLDPAKMNRGVLLLRATPEEKQLEQTAEEICSSAKPFNVTLRKSFANLTEVYSDILKKQVNEFYGLRDYYSLFKVIVTYAKRSQPSTDDLARAVQRNFGVLDSVNSLEIFSKEFNVEVKPAKTIDLVRENLELSKTEEIGLESRYLLLLSRNNAALSILLSLGIINEDSTEIIFGSGFPLDQDYSQVCRTVNRIKTCMETGRSVVLLNIQSLYESLYDALNQCYVKLGGSVYVDLGLGGHRVKCRVKKGFRIIIIEEKDIVYAQFPAPLLSRLEKHCLEFKTILSEHAKQVQDDLETQIEKTFSGSTQKTCDALIGFTEDSCASVLLQYCPEILAEEWDANKKDDIINKCKEKLVQCATPDSVIRVTQNGDKIQNIYFNQQTHTNLMDVIKKNRRDSDNKTMCLEVSTYSLLLNQRNLKFINEELNISKEQSFLLQIREFQTEQAFIEAVRKCFQTKSEDRVLILLQFFFENPKLSQRLLSCARYCIAKLLKESKESVLADVILLIRLPRVLGGCGYTAVRGDDWECVHLDELVPTKGLPADMEMLCKLSVSEVFEQSITHDNDDIGKQHPEKSQQMLVDTCLLIKMSMQKAIIQLNDKVDTSQRAQKRIEILHDLLYSNQDVSRNFLKVLERRVLNILAAREAEKSKSWVITLAESNSFVVEGTSFRHVLWIQLEDAVASAMAQVFAIADGDNNLDHVATDQPPDKANLWIKIFQEHDLLIIPVLPKLSYSVLSTSNTKESNISCRFPFSWAVKARFDQIWKQVHNLPGISAMSQLEKIQKCEELIKFPWLYGIKSTHSLFEMYAEDMVRMSMPECPHKLNQAFSKSLVELAKNVYKDLMQADPNDVSLLWLHVTYEGMRDNHQIFCKLSQQCGDIVNTGDVKEATEAMHLLLEKLQPSNELLKDTTTCQAWLNKVKSVSTSVEMTVSEDSLVQRHGTRGEELIKSIRRLWKSTQVVYLLMDNLLQDETQIEEKLLGIITKNFIHFSKRILKKDLDMEQTFMEVIRVLKQCNTNACKTYQKTDCAACGNEFRDPVELPCGHIFCILCIDENNAMQCFTCNTPFKSLHKLCEPLKREAVLQMNKFQCHCNSFFVEFIMKYCVESNTEIPYEVVNLLLDFVRGKPLRKDQPRRKTTELSPFHEFMDPSPAVQSLVLRILLQSRMDQMGPHLQKYIEAAVKSNQQTTDEFYFMVVRCTEDQIHRSAPKALIPKATECINMDFSSFETPESHVTFDVLHNIAKIRFAVSVATDVIGDLLQTPKGKEEIEYETNLLFWKIQEVISKNQWAHIFLLRNLCNKFDFKIITNAQYNEKLSWIVPKELQIVKDETPCTCTDKFLVYGAVYHDLTDTFDKKGAAEASCNAFPVCVTLAAVKQILHDRETAVKKNVIKQVEMVLKGNKKLKKMSALCKNVLENKLLKVSKEVCLSHDSSLTPIILHTVIVVNQSMAPELNLLKTLCSNPGKLKNTFIPTMPDTLQEMERMKTPESTEKFWQCECGEPVLVENCGIPMVIACCPKCKRLIGGEHHKPVPGFTEMQITADDQKGYILGDASIRIYPESERDLSGASLCLIRALIHSCLLWGAIDNYKATQDLIAFPKCDLGKNLSDHLRKDIELLGKALGKNTANSEIAVHMFLRHITETPPVPSKYKTDFTTTKTRKERNEWENIMESKTRTFFKDFEKNLSEVHNNILQWGETNPLANIVYNNLPEMEDLSTVGPFNCPLMWKYEQKMTIQFLTHLIEQDSSKKCPALQDIVRKHGHIKNIRHLPQILNLQQKLMHYFHYADSAEWKNVSFMEFLTKAPKADVPFLQESTNVLINILGNLKDSSYLDVPAHLKEKDRSSLMICDLLPLEKPQTIMRAVTHYLAKMQNDCIDSARTQCGEIESENLKPSHVISCDLEEDFLPIAISNIGYVLNEDGTETIDYNFRILEKQLISRFIVGKPHINLLTLPMMERNPVKTFQSFFSNVKDHLESLRVQDNNYIMNEMRFINEISAALSTLKIAIGFLRLSSSITFPDMLLVDYMKKELRMEDGSKHLQLPVLRTCHVKHIQSLWKVLFTRRSALLTEMNQDPFYMINLSFHVGFSEEEENNTISALARIPNLDLFIIELHDVIMNIETKDIKPDRKIRTTLETLFPCEKQLEKDSVISLWNYLGEDLEMKHIVSLWKLAVRRRA